MNRHRTYRFGDFAVDPESWNLTRHGREVHLEPSVLKLLLYLLSHRDRLVTRDELMETVWSETVVSDSALSKAVARLRHALNDDPGNPRFIETVHGRGYRFVADVDEYAGKATAAYVRSMRIGAGVISAGLVAVILLALFLFWPWQQKTNPPAADGIESLAVLPLSNLTGDPDQDYFADGIQDSMVTNLAKFRQLRVTSRQSTIRYRGSNKPLSEIARELGVNLLVEGSVLRVGDRVEVNLQLVRGERDEHLWAQNYTRETSRIFDLTADAANAIGTVLGLQPTAERTGVIDTRAIQAYWQGLKYMDRFSPTSLDTAIELLRKATDIEPGFGLAWGNLAAAYALRAIIGRAPAAESIELSRSAAQRALESNDHVHIGYSTLGWVQLWSGDSVNGCKSFQEALRLNPSARWAIHGEADCLMLDGRFDESVNRLRELQVLSPFAFVDNLPLTFHLFVARNYDAALEVIRELEERFPESPAGVNRSLVYWAQGDFDSALAEERRKLELRRDTVLLTALEEGLAAGGPRNAMRAVADALAERSATSFVDPFEIGKTYAHACAADEAIEWLEKAVDNRSFEIIHMPFRPDLDPLREDPRFEALLLRTGLVDESKLQRAERSEIRVADPKD